MIGDCISGSSYLSESLGVESLAYSPYGCCSYDFFNFASCIADIYCNKLDHDQYMHKRLLSMPQGKSISHDQASLRASRLISDLRERGFNYRSLRKMHLSHQGGCG